MDLLIDLGHTRLKWAWWRDGQVLARGAAPWRDRAPTELCTELWAGDQPAPGRVALAAVARGELVAALEAQIGGRFGLPVIHLHATAQCGGVTSGYQDPALLGVDRWAALLAVRRRAPDRPHLVADCGSAVTVDALDAHGLHRGGIILPGLALSAEAFFARTGRTPDAAATVHRDGLATGTAMAVASGALLATAGAIALMRTRVASSIGAPTVWLTGGDAAQVAALLEAPVHRAPDLVFEGMAVMLEQQR